MEMPLLLKLFFQAGICCIMVLIYKGIIEMELQLGNVVPFSSYILFIIIELMFILVSICLWYYLRKE